MTLRREVLFGGLLTFAFGVGASCACHAQALSQGRSKRTPHTFGCVLAESDVDRVQPIHELLTLDSTNSAAGSSRTGQATLIPNSKDRDFDRALANTLARISDLLQVLPGFTYFDDHDGMNAYATNRVRMQRPDGTVLMGQRMLARLMRMPEAPDACVAAVCAHEFGHILQYKTGIDRQLKQGQRTVKRAELNADWFAGYFAGSRKRERASFPHEVFAKTQFVFGDTDMNDPDHHGTPPQRAQAVLAGFEASYKQDLNLSDAVGQSLRYVSRV
jgi:hypothetical protein